MTLAGFHVSGDVVVLGAITGMVYGISAIGLVLVYRASRIINFAHGQIGTLAAAVLGVAVLRWHCPYWLAFAICLVAGAAVGAISEALLARRLRDAPLVVSVIATLGLSQLLYLVATTINSGASAGNLFPNPTLMPSFKVGALLVTPAYSAMLLITPVIVIALTIFLRKGRLGVAIRAASSNPDTARMAGIGTERMAGLSWAIAGAVAAFTAVLVLPTRPYSGADFLGPGLLLRALVCAVIARMVSLPIAFASAIALGIFESLLLANYPSGGLVEAALFALIGIALLVQRRRSGRAAERSPWIAVVPWPPIPEQYQRVFLIRNLGRIGALVLVGAALAADLALSNSDALTLSVIAAFAVVGLSVGVVTGLSGQLSLGQFAVAGVGAATYAILNVHGAPLILAIIAGCLASAVASLVLALPALRISGLMLAVTTLSFALAAQAWLFEQPWMLGSGKRVHPPRIGSWQLETGRSYFLFAIALFVIALWLTRNVWVSGVGTRMRAVRDNEDAARAFTIAPTALKLQGFVIAGFIAGIGGVIYGASFSLLAGSAFPLDASISAAATAVVGGLGVLIGPVLGTLYIIGVPRFVPLDNVGLLATALGWLILILQYPGGVAQSLHTLRARVITMLAARAGVQTSAATTADTEIAAVTIPRHPPATSSARAGDQQPLLRGEAITVKFGGIVAVRNISLAIRTGETLGLIGPNGAGKTTLFEALSGYVKPNTGTVWFDGHDITREPPEDRARRGLVRSFQDAALFPTMTVLEAVTLAHERVNPTRTGRSLAGVLTTEQRNRSHARELVGEMGLHLYRDTQIAALSTGTRRIVELACLIALQPALLLLDEPTSGIAQRETEALGPLLAKMKQELGLTLCVIEHDIPLVMALSNRVIAMESGRILAEGTPAAVRNDPQVIEAYLGGDLAAIERSSHNDSAHAVITRTVTL